MCFELPVALKYPDNSRQPYINRSNDFVKATYHNEWFFVSHLVSGEKVHVSCRAELLILTLQ